MTRLLGLILGALVLFKAGAYLLRWYEVTGSPDFTPLASAARLRRLASGIGPFLRECASALVVYAVWCVEAPLRPLLRRRADAAPDVPSGRPVILIHGFFMTPWSLGYLWRHLRDKGLGPLFLLDYHPMLGPIGPFADQLAARVDRLAGPEGPVDLVGHSMGGLIAARYAADHPGRVGRLVTVGTPFHGTRLWSMSVGSSLPQMRPGSDFLRALLAHPDFPGRTAVTSIYSPFDQIVLPADSSRLEQEGVRNVALEGLGHSALLLSPRVAREVAAALAAGPD